MREPRLARWLSDLRQDLRYGARQLWRAPTFSALLVGTLAIGIGANAMMANVIDHLLFTPPPHLRDPGTLARIVFSDSVGPRNEITSDGTNYSVVLDFAHGVDALEMVSAYSRAGLLFGSGSDALNVSATVVTPGFFTLLGTQPFRGRLFQPDDSFPADGGAGGPAIAVLSYDFWQRQFSGDQSVLGRQLRLGKLTYTVVGIAQPGFRGVEPAPPDLWLPATVEAPVEMPLLWSSAPGSRWIKAIARLSPKATRQVASQQATALFRQKMGPSSAGERVHFAPVILGRGPDAPRQTAFVFWLGGVSVLVLLIACANVSNLLLGRAVARRHEVAVRLSLGASQERLARQLLAEALILVTIGGAAALALASSGSAIIAHYLLSGVADPRYGVSIRSFLFTATVALGSAATIALIPWFQSRRSDLMASTRGSLSTGDTRERRTRSIMLGTQAALAMLLLVTSIAFVQSLREVRDLDLGVDLDHTLSVYLQRPSGSSAPAAGTRNEYQLLVRRIRAIPGVERVALAEVSPYTSGHAVGVSTPTRPETAYQVEVPMEVAVDSGFFRTVGATSLRGRDFRSTDRRGTPPVAIINTALAELIWPGEDPIGQCLLLEEPYESVRNCVTVVGVLPSFRRGSILNRAVLNVYRPLAQVRGMHGPPRSMFIRVTGDPKQVAPKVGRLLHAMRPQSLIPYVPLMRDVVAREYRPWYLAASMFSIFGLIALIIASIGLYAVVSFVVSQRTREIAIRRALGARALDVHRVVAIPSIWIVILGLAVGMGAAIAAQRWLGDLLFQTSLQDPRIIGGAAITLFAAAVAATIVPMIAALRSNLAAVLREA